MLGSFLCGWASAPLPVRLGEQGASKQGDAEGLVGLLLLVGETCEVDGTFDVEGAQIDAVLDG